MSWLDHPNLVKLKGFAMEPFAIVMDLLPCGNLFDFVNNPDAPRTWDISLRIAIDLSLAMHYLHTSVPTIIHRDLKSPNVLV